MRVLSPGVKDVLHFLLMVVSQGGSCNSLCSSLCLSILAPQAENPSRDEFAACVVVEGALTILLASLKVIELLNVVNLALDGCVHLCNPVVFSAGVLVVVVLILSHVASTHLCILSNELISELSIDLVVAQTEVLN